MLRGAHPTSILSEHLSAEWSLSISISSIAVPSMAGTDLRFFDFMADKLDAPPSTAEAGCVFGSLFSNFPSYSNFFSFTISSESFLSAIVLKHNNSK